MDDNPGVFNQIIVLREKKTVCSVEDTSVKVFLSMENNANGRVRAEWYIRTSSWPEGLGDRVR